MRAFFAGFAISTILASGITLLFTFADIRLWYHPDCETSGDLQQLTQQLVANGFKEIYISYSSGDWPFYISVKNRSVEATGMGSSLTGALFDLRSKGISINIATQNAGQWGKP